MESLKSNKLNRRNFILNSGIAGGGLVIGFNLFSSFKKNGDQVQVVMTKSAQMFTSNYVNS